MPSRPPAPQLQDKDLLASLFEFPAGFRSGRIREYANLIAEVIRRGLPVREEQYALVRGILEAKLQAFRSAPAKTSRAIVETQKHPAAAGHTFPANVRVQLAEMMRDDQATWEHTLREALQAWNEYETTRPRIGSIRRRR